MSTYTEAIDYIYSFTDYEKKTAYLYAAENFDLARMEHLLTLLDSPHNKVRAVHVAGSKGKGSTASMIAAIMRAAGYRVGLYTSPHLHTFRERIRINGQPIPEEAVAALVEEIRPFADQVSGITTFEIITSLAFLYFCREGVDIAVLEVGLGGRLDATNVVNPDVAVIASLSYDHTHLLGDTLTDIAREKAGIIKQGVPVVSSPQADEALAVIRQVCEQKGCHLTLVGEDWTWTDGPFDMQGRAFTFTGSAGRTSTSAPIPTHLDLWIPLLGSHQVVNATTAVAAVMRLREKGWRIPDSAIAEGLRQLRWPGRMEVLSTKPLLIVDSAHNADSAQKLVAALQAHFPERPIILILGASSDKDISGMLREFVGEVKQFIFTRSSHPRAADPEILLELVSALGGKGTVADNAAEALELALTLAIPPDLICGAGSVFIAAELRELWAAHSGVELDEQI